MHVVGKGLDPGREAFWVGVARAWEVPARVEVDVLKASVLEPVRHLSAPRQHHVSTTPAPRQHQPTAFGAASSAGAARVCDPYRPVIGYNGGVA